MGSCGKASSLTWACGRGYMYRSAHHVQLSAGAQTVSVRYREGRAKARVNLCGYALPERGGHFQTHIKASAHRNVCALVRLGNGS